MSREVQRMVVLWVGLMLVMTGLQMAGVDFWPRAMIVVGATLVLVATD